MMATTALPHAANYNSVVNAPRIVGGANFIQRTTYLNEDKTKVLIETPRGRGVVQVTPNGSISAYGVKDGHGVFYSESSKAMEGNSTPKISYGVQVNNSGNKSLWAIEFDGRLAMNYMRNAGVPIDKRYQVLKSFDVNSIKVITAIENTYGLRFYEMCMLIQKEDIYFRVLITILIG